MIVNELIEIIRDEELNYYACIQIGHPNIGKPLVLSYEGGAEIEGIFYDGESGTWKRYRIHERGTTVWKDGDYSETEACQDLLDYMRTQKRRRLETKNHWGRIEGKMHLSANIMPPIE